MKSTLSCLLVFILGVVLLGCPSETPEEVVEERVSTTVEEGVGTTVEEGVGTTVEEGVGEGPDPRIVAVGLPFPEEATLVDGLSSVGDGRAVVILETDVSADVLVQFYESKLNKLPTVRRFSDGTEYAWGWREGGQEKKVIVRPVAEALQGKEFQKGMSITLVSSPAE